MGKVQRLISKLSLYSYDFALNTSTLADSVLSASVLVTRNSHQNMKFATLSPENAVCMRMVLFLLKHCEERQWDLISFNCTCVSRGIQEDCKV